jgi:hypothetical protein
MAGGRRAAGEKMTGVGPTPTDRYDGLADFYDAQNAGSSESEVRTSAFATDAHRAASLRRRIGERHVPLAELLSAFTSCGLLIETVEENGDGLVPWRIGIAASKPA